MRWGTSKQTLLLGLGVIAILNLYVCCYVGFSKDYTTKEKFGWIIIAWVYPALGGLIALQHTFKHRRAKSLAEPPFVTANGQADTAPKNSEACNPPSN